MAFIFDGKMKIALNEIEGMNGEILPRTEEELVDYTLEVYTEMPSQLFNNCPLTDAFMFVVYDNRTKDIYDVVATGTDVVLRKRT